MIREAVILAGGYGTRLRDVIQDIPKPMALIRSRPFLEYLLAYLEYQGIQKVVLSLGYQSQIIINHFGNRFHSLEVGYSIEDEPLGTGGGILHALKNAQNEALLVVNGDSFFGADLALLYRFHQEKKADLSIALCHLDDTSRYGLVECDDSQQITGFREKSSVSGAGWINGGIYILRKDFFSERTPGERFSFEKEYIPAQLPRAAIYGYPAKGYFIDIGTPESFLKAQHEFERFEDKSRMDPFS
jgi:D-glycero-alpha-D-manno-heptose 1-phosphate guanylyltransferase